MSIILIIDDEETNQRLLKAILEAKGYETLQSDPLTMNIPVIALTSYAMGGDREKFLSIGFRDYLAKPISINEFLVLVDSYCS